MKPVTTAAVTTEASAEEKVIPSTVTIYDANGKPTTATEEDASEMVKHCGYSKEWPRTEAAPAASEKPATPKDDQAAGDAAASEAAGSSTKAKK